MTSRSYGGRSRSVALVMAAGAVVLVACVVGRAEASCPDIPRRHVSPKQLAAILKAHTLWLDTSKQQGRRADLSNARLGGRDLRAALLSEADLSGAILDVADLRNARLEDALLDCASLTRARLNGVSARGIRLREAQLQSADFTGAVLRFADFSAARVWNAELKDADLAGAIFQRAQLVRTRLAGSRLTGADLIEAVYEPANAPSAGEVGGLIGLDSLRIPDGDYGGAAQLRAALKASGLTSLERQVTHSIETWRTREYSALSGTASLGAIGAGIWAGLRCVGFGLTTRYGLQPTRALGILAVLWLLYTPLYAFAVWRRAQGRYHGALVRVRPEKRLVYTPPCFFSDPTPAVERVMTRNIIAAFAWGLYFSLLTACQMGFREVQPAGWIKGLQISDFDLKPWGWIRVIAGTQSLLSLYLLVIWVLTQFGSIFE